MRGSPRGAKLCLMLRSLCVAVCLALALATPAAATTWTRPVDVGVGFGDGDSAPRASIASDGSSVVAWRQLDQRRNRLLVSTGDAGGRFSRTRVIGRPTGVLQVFPFARGGGRSTVMWSDGRGLHIDRRLVLAGRFEAIDVARDGSGWLVLYAGGRTQPGFTEVGVAALTADGSRRDVTTLGTGYVWAKWARGQLLAVDLSGRAAALWSMPVDPASFSETADVVSVRSRRGAWSAPTGLGERAHDASVVSRPGVGSVLTWTQMIDEREWAFYGQPMVRIGGAPFAVPVRPSETVRRLFAPSAVPLRGGRALVVYQYDPEARYPTGGAVRAAVVGAGVTSRVQRLTEARAKEPQLAALSNGRTLVVWQEQGRWRAALANADGRCSATVPPPGPAARGAHTAQTNRDLRASGRHAILVWDVHGAIRVSVADVPAR